MHSFRSTVGAFAKLRKAAISFVMSLLPSISLSLSLSFLPSVFLSVLPSSCLYVCHSVCPPIRNEQLCYHRTDFFYEIPYLQIFRNIVNKIQVDSNLTRVTNTIHDNLHTFVIISHRILLRIWNVLPQRW
jgi:hypothetical protein